MGKHIAVHVLLYNNNGYFPYFLDIFIFSRKCLISHMDDGFGKCVTSLCSTALQIIIMVKLIDRLQLI